MERQLYVPPGRRHARKPSEDRSISDCIPTENLVAGSSGTARSLSSENCITVGEESEQSSSRSSSMRESSDEDIIRSCLLLTNFPADMSEVGKQNILSRFVRKGAQSKWIGPHECLLAFKNEKMATSAAGNGNSQVYKTFLLKNVITERGELLAGAKELYYCIKPDMDSRVAHRLIGAALGIKVPSRSPAAENIPSKAALEPVAPVVDAWDD